MLVSNEKPSELKTLEHMVCESYIYEKQKNVRFLKEGK